MRDAIAPPSVEIRELRLLDALLAEHSVTKAAARVGLSQPAASNALARLRHAANDPLFVRSGRGIAPTPRALQMAPMLARVLGELDRAFVGHRRFDPETSDEIFRVAATDFGELVLLPPLLKLLSTRAPRVGVQVIPLGTAFPMTELESGSLDLVIGSFRTAPPRLYRQVLFSEGSVSLVRQGHPQARRRLTLPQFAALGHVLVSPRGETRGIIDDVLEQKGLSRRVVATVPHFLAAVFLVQTTDLVVTLPERVARSFQKALDLVVVPTPVSLPRVTISQLCHERALKDPARRWFRGALLEVARAL
ncbi:MAG: LysR family transcriptional regulator [Myxococcota bacterium]